MGYRLVYDLSKIWQVVLRNILLLLSVGADFFVGYNIFTAIAINSIDWLFVILFIAISGTMRVIAIHLCYKIEYEIYEEIFTIKKQYILYSKTLLKCNVCELTQVQIQKKHSAIISTTINIVDLTDETSVKYNVFTTNNGNYICNLDEYMHSELTKGIKI